MFDASIAFDKDYMVFVAPKPGLFPKYFSVDNDLNPIFLGPRGPLIEPSIPVPSRPSRPVRAKNPDHLYSLIIHHRTTVNLSNHIFCESW